MSEFAIVTEAGFGVTVAPYQDLILLQASNAEGGRAPLPLTIEEAMALGEALITEALQAKLAFGEDIS